MQVMDTRVRLGDTTELNFQLAPGAGTVSKEDAAKNATIKGLFDEGVAASKASDYDGAIAKFNEADRDAARRASTATTTSATRTRRRRTTSRPRQSFQKAIEMKVDYVEAYNGLATVYNAQKKFEEAQVASAKAAELAAAAAAATRGRGGAAPASTRPTTRASSRGTPARRKMRRRSSRRRSR